MEALALIVMLLFFNPNAEPMSRQDIALEATYMAFHVADWGQTRDITMSPNYGEGNHILGRDPSIERINRYFLSTAILHAGIVKSLSKEYRTIFQTITISIEAGFVRHNASVGMKVNF